MIIEKKIMKMMMMIVMIIIEMTTPVSNGNRNEWSTIQGVIGRVISNHEHDYPWIVRHEVPLPINCQ